MTLEAVFDDLCTSCQKLQEGLIDLRTTIIEDKPLDDDSVLVDVFGDAAEELLGWIDEALTALGEGQQAAVHQIDRDGARQALTSCQERVNRIHQRFSSDLISYERITELMQFGRERGGEWRAWANTVKQALDQCQQPLHNLNQTLFRCWQELAASASRPSAAGTPGPHHVVPEDGEAAGEATT